MIRGYVPGGVGDVKRWFDDGQIPAGAPVRVVTAALRADNPQSDDEELEYLACLAAMEQAQVIAAGDRVAVVAVDVGRAGDELAEPVPVQRWAAVFVDDMLWHAVDEVRFL